MKKVLSIIICLCLSFSTPGQIPILAHASNSDYGFNDTLWGDYEPVAADSLDSELTRVYYDYTYTGKNTITGIWLLQVGSNTTRFLPERRYVADSVQRINPSMRAQVARYSRDGDLFHFYDSYCISDNRCRFACRFVLDDIMYEENLPTISWELQDSVANICGHFCRSAIGSFRGRTYYVFYAEDIPVSAGPWKLSGLPGLILHAEVDDGKFIFHAKQIGPPTGAPILWTKYPYTKVSRKEYMKMLTQMQQNYRVAYSAHLSRNPAISLAPDRVVVYPDLSWIESLETE